MDVMLPSDRVVLHRCQHFLEDISVDDKIMSRFFSCPNLAFSISVATRFRTIIYCCFKLVSFKLLLRC